MTPRRFAQAAALAGLGSALSVAFLDVRIARWVAGLPGGVEDFFRTGTDWLDLVSTKEFSNRALGLALVLIALAAWTRPARRRLAKVLVLVALTNVLAHAVVGLLKPVFGRLRPYQIEDADWVNRFFAGGSSFPSGHTAFYFGLCLPLAWAWPRWRIPLLLPACFIGAARVLVNDHFAGDVLGALALTSGVCAVLVAAFQRFARLERSGSTRASPTVPGE